MSETASVKVAAPGATVNIPGGEVATTTGTEVVVHGGGEPATRGGEVSVRGGGVDRTVVTGTVDPDPDPDDTITIDADAPVAVRKGDVVPIIDDGEIVDEDEDEIVGETDDPDHDGTESAAGGSAGAWWGTSMPRTSMRWWWPLDWFKRRSITREGEGPVAYLTEAWRARRAGLLAPASKPAIEGPSTSDVPAITAGPAAKGLGGLPSVPTIEAPPIPVPNFGSVGETVTAGAWWVR